MEGWATWSGQWGGSGGLGMGERRPRGDFVLVRLPERHGVGAPGGCVGAPERGRFPRGVCPAAIASGIPGSCHPARADGKGVISSWFPLTEEYSVFLSIPQQFTPRILAESTTPCKTPLLGPQGLPPPPEAKNECSKPQLQQGDGKSSLPSCHRGSHHLWMDSDAGFGPKGEQVG